MRMINVFEKKNKIKIHSKSYQNHINKKKQKKTNKKTNKKKPLHLCVFRTEEARIEEQ
jgi:hypothetical protein